MSTDQPFVPLRTDPPPELATTLWVRLALVSAIFVALLSVLAVELLGRPGDVVGHPVVAVAHGIVLVLLITWSRRSLTNADLLVPATRYSPPANPVLIGVLWSVAFLAPLCAGVVIAGLDTEFADTDAFFPTLTMITVVLLAFVLAWLPFRYHLRHAQRIGTPTAPMTAWYWAPVLAFVIGLVVIAFAMQQRLAADGFSSVERTVRMGAAYGLPVAVFGLTTWRAIAVVDEVIDLRWQRWKTEWEQTLADMAAQPPPGPEREVPRS